MKQLFSLAVLLKGEPFKEAKVKDGRLNMSKHIAAVI